MRTAANLTDITQNNQLLYGQEAYVCNDDDYRPSLREYKGISMRNWLRDLLEWAAQVESEEDLLHKLCQYSQSLDFEWCSYHVQHPFPISNPTTVFASNYPEAWQRRYLDKNYVKSDPVVKKARKVQLPFLWEGALLEQDPIFWKDAEDAGLKVGWTCSSISLSGIFSMLSVARRNPPLTASELNVSELKMRWLADATHIAVGRLLTNQGLAASYGKLTAREIEILRWTADGKTQHEISQILSISFDTVKFHSKNAIYKLGAFNKTAAVVRASVLGVLS